MDAEPNRIDLKSTFQDETIHQKWEAAYRNHRYLDKLNDAIFARFMKRIQSGRESLVLDAGCGIGDHALRFAKLGHKTVGIDLSAGMLAKARERASQESPANPPQYHELGIEEIWTLDQQFDVVHCRGVLMHIPDWKKALRSLCESLKPNGQIVIIENNHKSCEANLVRLARLLRKNSRRLVVSEDGLEFYDSKKGYAPLTRMANIQTLIKQLEKNRIESFSRFSSHFFDVNRFPAGLLRETALRWNRLMFGVHCPPRFCCENVVIGKKAANA